MIYLRCLFCELDFWRLQWIMVVLWGGRADSRSWIRGPFCLEYFLGIFFHVRFGHLSIGMWDNLWVFVVFVNVSGFLFYESERASVCHEFCLLWSCACGESCHFLGRVALSLANSIAFTDGILCQERGGLWSAFISERVWELWNMFQGYLMEARKSKIKESCALKLGGEIWGVVKGNWKLLRV